VFPVCGFGRLPWCLDVRCFRFLIGRLGLWVFLPSSVSGCNYGMIFWVDGSWLIRVVLKLKTPFFGYRCEIGRSSVLGCAFWTGCEYVGSGHALGWWFSVLVEGLADCVKVGWFGVMFYCWWFCSMWTLVVDWLIMCAIDDFSVLRPEYPILRCSMFCEVSVDYVYMYINWFEVVFKVN